MNPLECVGWHPSLSLVHRLSEAGYSAPWEMTARVFEDFVGSLSPKAREELDRIDRALHAAGNVSETARFYGEMLTAEDPALAERIAGIEPNDTLRIFSVIPEHEDRAIRSGDVVTLDKNVAQEAKGRGKVVSMEAKAMDVDWPGQSAKIWVYAPVFCRNQDASVHDFLIAYALDAGHFVPPRVWREYIMRVS